MESFILVLHIFIAFILIGMVMMQRSEGGGTGFGGSSPSMMGLSSARGKANFLTKMTSYLVAGFLLTSLTLAVLASRKVEAPSLVDQLAPAVKETTSKTPSVPIL